MGRYLISRKVRIIHFILQSFFVAQGVSIASDPGAQKTYQLEYVETSCIVIDGFASEGAWAKAAERDDMFFPWKQSPAPVTVFRAFYSDEYVFFFFEADDEDLVVYSGPGEQSVAKGDRVELFFSAGLDMDKYFCLEIDPAGRVLDYRASFYRKFDRTWDLEGLITAGQVVPGGYSVEAAIPISWFRNAGISSMEQGSSITAGVFRAEFSNRTSGVVAEDWISWQDPGTRKADFHIPSSLGIFLLGPVQYPGNQIPDNQNN